MTHTLHRRGTEQNLSNDFVLLCMAAKGYNEEGSEEKMREFLRIAARHNPVNMGDMRIGNMHKVKLEEILPKIKSTSIVHAVFTNLDTVADVVREVKDANLGMSIVLSSTFNLAKKCAAKAGVNTHSIEYSLGIWGALEKLPSNDVLEITTMCGHGLVASKLTKSIREKVKAGKITAAEGARLLAQPCPCGIVNTDRCAELLENDN